MEHQNAGCVGGSIIIMTEGRFKTQEWVVNFVRIGTYAEADATPTGSRERELPVLRESELIN